MEEHVMNQRLERVAETLERIATAAEKIADRKCARCEGEGVLKRDAELARATGNATGACPACQGKGY